MYNNQAPRINNQYPQSNQFSNTNQNNQTSSAVPFSSQSYPNNPETPGYPQYQFQRNILNQQVLKKPNTPAYTIPIKERNCKNKIVAEVLLIQLKNI